MKAQNNMALPRVHAILDAYDDEDLSAEDALEAIRAVMSNVPWTNAYMARYLALHGGVNPRELADACNIPNNFASGVLSMLASRGDLVRHDGKFIPKRGD